MEIGRGKEKMSLKILKIPILDSFLQIGIVYHWCLNKSKERRKIKKEKNRGQGEGHSRFPRSKKYTDLSARVEGRIFRGRHNENPM